MLWPGPHALQESTEAWRLLRIDRLPHGVTEPCALVQGEAALLYVGLALGRLPYQLRGDGGEIHDFQLFLGCEDRRIALEQNATCSDGSGFKARPGRR